MNHKLRPEGFLAGISLKIRHDIQCSHGLADSTSIMSFPDEREGTVIYLNFGRNTPAKCIRDFELYLRAAAFTRRTQIITPQADVFRYLARSLETRMIKHTLQPDYMHCAYSSHVLAASEMGLDLKIHRGEDLTQLEALKAVTSRISNVVLETAMDSDYNTEEGNANGTLHQDSTDGSCNITARQSTTARCQKVRFVKL